MKASRIDDAVEALSLDLTDEEAARLEAPYTPRRDIQAVCDLAALTRMMAEVGVRTAAAWLRSSLDRHAPPS